MKWIVLPLVAALCGCQGDPPPTEQSPPVQPPVRPDTSPERIRWLLDHLHDDPSPRHFYSTASVEELIDIGEPALEPTLPYVLSDDWETRYLAEHVIGGILMKMSGFVRGRGWPDEREREFRKLEAALWDPDGVGTRGLDKAPPEARRAFVERVKRWLAARRA